MGGVYYPKKGKTLKLEKFLCLRGLFTENVMVIEYINMYINSIYTDIYNTHAKYLFFILF